MGVSPLCFPHGLSGWFWQGARQECADFMPTEPAQIALAVFELCLFLSGVALAIWLLASAEARRRWLGTNALPARPMATADFILIAALIFLVGFAFQAAVQLGLGATLDKAADHKGLTLFVYSVANYTGALVAWKFMFPSLRRSWVVEPDAPPPLAPPARLPWSQVLR